jgi:dihydrofolate reductase
MYTVIGERIETSVFDSQDTLIDRHDTVFGNYQSALDYYDTTFSDVSKDICHLGGEFIITMLNNDKVIKRHIVSTTVSNEQA